MHHGQSIASILVVVAGLLVIGVSVHAADGGALPAESGSPSLSPTPTASLPPVVKPASAATVRWALKWRRAAVHVWAQWNRARRCLSLRVVPFHKNSGARQPSRAASGARWMDAGHGWKHDLRQYRQRTGKLVYRMKHPGGTSSGARWLALARWVGWPSSTWSMLTAVIMRESSGRERAGEENGGIFRGLMQVWRSHVAARFWGLLYTAEHNLRVGLHLWRESGWGPWAQTAY